MADLSRVWVVFDAFESDLPWITEGASVTFQVAPYPHLAFQSKVSFISPVIDIRTRTTNVRAEVENPDFRLKPEMLVQGSILFQFSHAILALPKSAVMWTGERSVIYVKDPESDHPVFQMREVDLGRSVGNYYEILNGVREGEEVVTHGTFTVDAAAQLAGKTSMMNRQDGMISSGHDHHTHETHK
jgi:Cu(I)/Ag(I) efflux system membrane fusion protein